MYVAPGQGKTDPRGQNFDTIFPIQSQWERSVVYNSVVSGPIWPKFEFVRDFMHVPVTCKYKKDRIKNNLATSFSPL